MTPKYKRIMIKISGEAMSGHTGFGLDHETIEAIAEQIKNCYDLGCEIGIVIGGQLLEGSRRRGHGSLKGRSHGNARHGHQLPCDVGRS